MATEKLFTVAGTATNPDGTTKARFANDFVARVKILTKAGCSNIDLVELPRPMTKLEALEHLQTLGKTGDAGYVVANKLVEKKNQSQRASKSVTLRTGKDVKVTSAKSKAKTKAERAVEIGLADSLEEAREGLGDERL
jgi:hypothetical protein